MQHFRPVFALNTKQQKHYCEPIKLTYQPRPGMVSTLYIIAGSLER